MSIQRQQLRKDKNQALEFLKERLIQVDSYPPLQAHV